MWLGSHGHSMPKPSVFWTDLPDIFGALYEARPVGLKGNGTKKVGKWVCGTSELKGSQVYPERFCFKFVSIFADKYWGGALGEDTDSEIEESQETSKPTVTLHRFFKLKPKEVEGESIQDDNGNPVDIEKLSLDLSDSDMISFVGGELYKCLAEAGGA